MIQLGPGESIIVTWNPEDDIEETPGQRGGRQFTFHALNDAERPISIKGGARLFDAWLAMLGKSVPKQSFKVKVTAYGEPGSLNRTWEVTKA